jgi:amino-acid N-acetyltransferase
MISPAVHSSLVPGVPVAPWMLPDGYIGPPPGTVVDCYNYLQGGFEAPGIWNEKMMAGVLTDTGNDGEESLVDIRSARSGDIDAIHALVLEASRTTTVLPQPREMICNRLQSILVSDRQGQVSGCGMLYLFTDNLAEIKSLVVHPDFRGSRIGSRLVHGLLDRAGSLNVERVFALTDNVPFFERLGFRHVGKEGFPHKVWNECILCPKLLDCQEDAVEIILGDEPPVA